MLMFLSFSSAQRAKCSAISGSRVAAISSKSSVINSVVNTWKISPRRVRNLWSISSFSSSLRINVLLICCCPAPVSYTHLDVYKRQIEVLSGREVQTQITHYSQGPVFTVAVPWIQDDTVLGAVFIHTSSQIIEAEYLSLIHI